MFVLKILKVKRKTRSMVTFYNWGWRDKQMDILQESPGRVWQERYSKIFGKTYRKTRVQRPFSKNISGCRPATLFEERLMQRFLFCDIFKTCEQLFYSIVHTWIAASDLIENLETLTISEGLRKSLNILTIIVDFTINIWDFSVAMKQSENRI